MTPYFNDWKRFCLVLREIAAGTSGQPLSGVEARNRAQRVLAEAGYQWPECVPDDELIAALEMTQGDVYRQAVQRTFAALYGVPTDSVHVVRSDESTTVQFAGKTFIRQAGSEDRGFVSEDEDPVTITLSDEERRYLPRSV
jgi:hypothetical protein